MRTKTVLMAMMGCLGLATAVQSAVTLTLNPASGAVSGLAGSTVGWGFTLDSATDFAVISSSNFCLGNSGVSSLCSAPAIGTYTDFIAANYTIAGPAPENPALTEAFDAMSAIGVGSFKISALAALGAVNTGQIVVTYDLYSVDPNAANFNPGADLISAGNFLTAPASVTVEAPMSRVPEPSYSWVMAGLVIVWLAGRRVVKFRQGPALGVLVIAAGSMFCSSARAQNMSSAGGASLGTLIQNQQVTPIAGDFNGDGKGDFVLIGSTSIYAYLSDGNGIFTEITSGYPGGWAFGSPPNASWTPIVGDFNGDGKTDFALVQNSTVHTFLSNGNGAFTGGTYLLPGGWSFGSPPGASWTPITGDFNADGKTDFAFAQNSTLHTFLSNGDGTFKAGTFSFGESFGSPPSSSYTVVTGDLNDDGKADFAFASSSAIYGFFSKGDGTFTATAYEIPANRQAAASDKSDAGGKSKGSPPNAYTAFVGDLNDDHKTDLAYVTSTQIFAYFSAGDGTFTPTVWNMGGGWAFGSPPSSSWTPIVGDFNNDGKIDLALLQNSTLHTFLSSGTGSFAQGTYGVPNGWSFGSPPSATYTLITGNFDGVNGTDFLLFDDGIYYCFLSSGNGSFTASVY